MLARGHRALEAFEDASAVLVANADALVPHAQKSCPTVRAQGHGDGPAGAELDGVRQQVPNDLLHREPVEEAHDPFLQVRLQAAPRDARGDFRPIHHGANHAGEIGLLQLEVNVPCRDTRNIEEHGRAPDELLHRLLQGFQPGGDHFRAASARVPCG